MLFFLVMGFQSCFEQEKYWSVLDLIFIFKQARKTDVSELYMKQLQKHKVHFPCMVDRWSFTFCHHPKGSRGPAAPTLH